MTDLLLPPGFAHATPIQVRWSDVDAMGHVNNAKYLTYVEQARITYFNERGLWDGSGGGLGLIMAKVTMDFRQPIRDRDQVYVTTRTTRLGNSSFDTEQWIMRRPGGEGDFTVAATASIVIVVYDYAVGAPQPIPDAWRESLRADNPDL